MGKSVEGDELDVMEKETFAVRLDPFRPAVLSTRVFPNDSRLEAKGSYRCRNSFFDHQFDQFRTLHLETLQVDLEPFNSGRCRGREAPAPLPPPPATMGKTVDVLVQVPAVAHV